MKIYEKLLVGTYFLLLKTEGRGKFVLDQYYAWSTVIAVVFVQTLLYFSLALVFNPALMSKVAWNVLAMVVFFVFAYFVFVKNGKYKKLVKKYKSSYKNAVAFAIWSNVSVFAFLVSASVYLVNKNGG